MIDESLAWPLKKKYIYSVAILDLCRFLTLDAQNYYFHNVVIPITRKIVKLRFIYRFIYETLNVSIPFSKIFL